MANDFDGINSFKLKDAYFYRMENAKYIHFFTICFLAVIMSCSPRLNFKKDEENFQSSKVISTYKAIADMNDAYFVIKENNYFEFYRQLFDSVKNTSYPGRFTKSGDTLFLHFYNKKGRDFLGSKAFINPEKKEIIFFDHYPGIKMKINFN